MENTMLDTNLSNTFDFLLKVSDYCCTWLRHGTGIAMGCEVATRLCHPAVQAAEDAGGCGHATWLCKELALPTPRDCTCGARREKQMIVAVAVLRR